MAKLLIVDDENKIRELIAKYALHDGFQVDEASDGVIAVQMAKDNNYDLIIMDIMMPNLDGYNACKLIKSEKNTPIILLSAMGEEYDKLKGFELGVDDYVVKPFSPKELLMRVKAIIARTKGADKGAIFIQEGLKIDYTSRIVTIDDEVANLSPKEYQLLTYLVENQGIALTREQLLQNVWGYDFFGDDRTLDTHIKLLRRSLKEYAKFIVTLRGVGYRFEKVA